MKTDTNIINKMKEPRKILLPHGAAKRLGEALGVTQPTIRKALRFEESICNAEEASLARKIRYAAMRNFGGMDSGEPDMETAYGEDGLEVARWRYGNGAVLTLNLRTGEAKIERDGRTIDQADSIETRTIVDWKIKAENI